MKKMKVLMSDVVDLIDQNVDIKGIVVHGKEFIRVVRCNDCKKYIPCQKLPIGASKWCDLFDRATCEMNYCAWGERREDETD